MANRDLLEHLELPGLECLNEQPGHAVANAVKQGYREDDGLYLESDCDEQLLLNIPFNQKVKIQSIAIRATSEAHAPKTVKLYVNRASMGFSDVSSVPCAQELELTPAQLNGDPIPLKFVKFQNVNILTIFVENNQGGEDNTRINKVAVFGQTGEVFNVAEIKKQEDS